MSNVSIFRQINNFRRLGWREWLKQSLQMPEARTGTLVGTDELGNKYYENMTATEVPGRHRWVFYANHDYNASQVPPEWHAWVNHIRKDPPYADPVVQASIPKWRSEYHENLTGTRGAFKTYSTTAPKVTGGGQRLRRGTGRE